MKIRYCSTPEFFLITAFLLSHCLIGAPQAIAQSTHRFTKGLAVEVPYNYGREAVYTDELLWHFYKGSLPQPKEGQTLEQGQPGEGGTWRTIEVDTAGFFRLQRSSGALGPNNPPGPGRIDQQRGANTPNQQARPGPSYLYLSYQSPKDQAAVLHISGNGAVLLNGELHAGDPYRLGWMYIPVKLKRGLNRLYVRGTFVSAELLFPSKPIFLLTEDATLPDVVQGKENSKLIAGLVIANTSSKVLHDLTIASTVNGELSTASVEAILPFSTRKVRLLINASSVMAIGDVSAKVSLKQGSKVLDEQNIKLRSVDGTIPYRVTFSSGIDGSVQYYAVNPAKGGEKAGDALFLSVHGAGVEALGQAQAYAPKDWGTLVAPTNRRPRGFNWEDWGRLDALEVLALASERLQPDTQRIYLTGHSMGGHGSWFLGATYPGKWAAIAPCAGYPTLKGYGSADGLIPQTGRTENESLLLRASNQSDVVALATNFKPLGVYVLHGDADRTVSVEYARQMKKVLVDFQPDFSYYEYPGGSHWYSNESVDWQPLFDYFRWHSRKMDTAVHHIDFKTANPGVSASYYWATLYQQQEPLEYSRVVLTRDLANGHIEGMTENVALLQLALNDFQTGQVISVMLDSLQTIAHTIRSSNESLFLRKAADGWEPIPKPSLDQKGPHRNGTFKEAFNHHMVYVYGTRGTSEENKWALEKARYDAESWYYRGNGAFDIVADQDFDGIKYKDRNIILIGNADTNSAWDALMQDSPIQVGESRITIGSKAYEGDDIGTYFAWKRPGSTVHTIGVIAGTGIKGMQAALANQYFAGGSGFPDYTVFHYDILKNGPDGVLTAGFYDNEWKVKP